MAKKNTILNNIKKVVISIDDKAELILFGSRARGDAKEDSDWDVLILSSILADGKFRRGIRDELFYVGLESNTCISSIILSKVDWETKFNKYPLYYQVKNEGIIL